MTAAPSPFDSPEYSALHGRVLSCHSWVLTSSPTTGHRIHENEAALFFVVVVVFVAPTPRELPSSLFFSWLCGWCAACDDAVWPKSAGSRLTVASLMTQHLCPHLIPLEVAEIGSGPRSGALARDTCCYLRGYDNMETDCDNAPSRRVACNLLRRKIYVRWVPRRCSHAATFQNESKYLSSKNK